MEVVSLLVGWIVRKITKMNTGIIKIPVHFMKFLYVKGV